MEEDKNYISMIHGDLTRAAQMQNGMPENIGVMSIKTANRTILEASQLPTPRALWDKETGNTIFTRAYDNLYRILNFYMH